MKAREEDQNARRGEHETTPVRLKDGSVIETEIHALSPDEQSGFTSNGIQVVRFGEHWMERHILEKLTAWAKAYFSPRSPGPILPNFGPSPYSLTQFLAPSVEILQLRYQEEDKEWNAVLKISNQAEQISLAFAFEGDEIV